MLAFAGTSAPLIRTRQKTVPDVMGRPVSERRTGRLTTNGFPARALAEVAMALPATSRRTGIDVSVYRQKELLFGAWSNATAAPVAKSMLADVTRNPTRLALPSSLR
jgi:hypothetical protein